MSIWFTVVVVVFVIVAVILIRRQIGGAIFERLPILPDEKVLLVERGLKIFHKIREASGGQSLTYRVTVVLTDRRILIATGGPEGKHKFFIKMILDYRKAAPQVNDSGYGAYYSKFHLENGYATYYVSPKDVHFIEKKGKLAVRIQVAFPEHGSFYVEPEIIIYTDQPEKYREVFSERD